MDKAIVFYNPLAGRETSAEALKKLENMISAELTFCDMTNEEAYRQALSEAAPETILILCGGDGTLNRFINLTDGSNLPNPVLYYPCGSGNDFAHDLGKNYGDSPFSISEYLKDLPSVEVNGTTYRFLNGVGYGIDGYCCEVGDQLKKESDKPINYAGIAIKGLLFHYKPTAATITVDGNIHHYRKVWLAPTMNGRFYGGGMMPTPDQDRTHTNGQLSTMVFYGSGKLKTLAIFPGIFKGTHVNHTDVIEVLTGHDITVEFDRPTALQIDGETILGVTRYHAIGS